MKYMGSKNRIAKFILPIMIKEANEKGITTWVEPFVGGANMIDKVPNNFQRIGIDFNFKRIGADLNEYVIALLNEMSKPTFVAPIISEEKYNELKSNKDLYDKWVVGYAGTQLSFGATWFGSYRRDNSGKRNYCLEAQNNVNKQSKSLQGVEFIHSSYDSLKVPKNSFIYCDPPYQTIATKGKYKDDFNHKRFWQWCRDMATKGHIVYVSEYNAPNDFECVWQKEIVSSLTQDTGSKKSVEKLFKFSPTNVQ